MVFEDFLRLLHFFFGFLPMLTVLPQLPAVHFDTLEGDHEKKEEQPKSSKKKKSKGARSDAGALLKTKIKRSGTYLNHVGSSFAVALVYLFMTKAA